MERVVDEAEKERIEEECKETIFPSFGRRHLSHFLAHYSFLFLPPSLPPSVYVIDFLHEYFHDSFSEDDCQFPDANRGIISHVNCTVPTLCRCTINIPTISDQSFVVGSFDSSFLLVYLLFHNDHTRTHHRSRALAPLPALYSLKSFWYRCSMLR